MEDKPFTAAATLGNAVDLKGYSRDKEEYRMWFDIEVGKPLRIRNNLGQELDRTIVSMTEKTVTYQRHEVEEGKVSTIDKRRFMELYNSLGVPYVEGQYGDRLEAELNPDFDWDWDEEEGQLAFNVK